MSHGSRLRQTGWIALLLMCGACFLVLTFHVNSVKNKVHLAEREIIQLEKKKQTLEIEFQARANQQQLANWNKIDFGYEAPRADQYLDNERQLAALGLAREVNAPEPIRVARNSADGNTAFPAMVSPMSGMAASEDRSADDQPANSRNSMSANRSLAERLSRTSGFAGQIGEVRE
jgi:hypothetical protein